MSNYQNSKTEGDDAQTRVWWQAPVLPMPVLLVDGGQQARQAAYGRWAFLGLVLAWAGVLMFQPASEAVPEVAPVQGVQQLPACPEPRDLAAVVVPGVAAVTVAMEQATASAPVADAAPANPWPPRTAKTVKMAVQQLLRGEIRPRCKAKLGGLKSVTVRIRHVIGDDGEVHDVEAKDAPRSAAGKCVVEVVREQVKAGWRITRAGRSEKYLYVLRK